MKIEEMITDKQIEEVFDNTNFGSAIPRDLIQDALLKHVCGFASGHTIEQIIKELNLVTKGNRITKTGKLYLYFSLNPLPKK